MIDIAKLQAGSELLHHVSGITYRVRSVRDTGPIGGYVEMEDATVITLPIEHLHEYSEVPPKYKGARIACPRCGSPLTIEHVAGHPACERHIKSLTAIRSRSMRRINSRAGGARPGNKNAVKQKPESLQDALGGAK